VRVQVRTGGRPALELPILPGTAWIGSGPDCLVRIQGRGIGARHARLDVTQDGRFSVVDLGCPAGTRVNGERVVTAGPLGAWDVLRVGDAEIRIADLAAGGAASRADSTDRGYADAAFSASDATGGAVPGEAFLAAARRAHRELLGQLDLRRRDVAGMSDLALRQLAASVLRPIAAGEHPGNGVEADRLVEFVLDEALGLGPLEPLLADDSVREIMVNGPDAIFTECGGRITRAAYRFSGEPALRGIVDRIVAPVGRRVDDASPMVDARLPDGSRVNVVVPPLALRGTAVTIRRFGKRRPSAQDLLENATLSPDMLDFLRTCVVHRRNMIVSGGTGSGKTTLLNVLSSLIPREERVVTIEDSAELAFDHPNLVALETRPRNMEGRGEITVRDLVRNALRMRPDRIVIGECRGGETLDMLQAMNTGHDGSLSTVHANSPRELLSRLEVMVLMSGVELPIHAIREQVAASVHVVVHQARFPSGARRITRITEVTGISAGVVQTQDIFRYDPGGGDASLPSAAGTFRATGHVPQFYEALARSGSRLDLGPFVGGATLGPGGRA
jgi:pilus assembly protein CpaF